MEVSKGTSAGATNRSSSSSATFASLNYSSPNSMVDATMVFLFTSRLNISQSSMSNKSEFLSVVREACKGRPAYVEFMLWVTGCGLSILLPIKRERNMSFCLLKIMYFSPMDHLSHALPLVYWSHITCWGPSFRYTLFCNPWVLHFPFVNSSYVGGKNIPIFLSLDT